MSLNKGQRQSVKTVIFWIFIQLMQIIALRSCFSSRGSVLFVSSTTCVHVHISVFSNFGRKMMLTSLTAITQVLFSFMTLGILPKRTEESTRWGCYFMMWLLDESTSHQDLQVSQETPLRSQVACSSPLSWCRPLEKLIHQKMIWSNIHIHFLLLRFRWEFLLNYICLTALVTNYSQD